MDHRDETPSPPPADWLDALDRAEAEIAAGRIVTLEPVLARMDESVVRLEAKQVRKEAASAKS